MADEKWGHCQHCRHFGSLAPIPLPGEEARCNHAELKRYELRVFGAGGCKGFELRAGLEEGVEAPERHVSA
jgi:hypothetical protein